MGLEKWALSAKSILLMATVDRERFAGINICSFSAIFFTEIFVSLTISAHYLVQLKRCLYSQKKYRGTPETVKNVKV